MKAIIWTEAMDRALIVLRHRGENWSTIAEKLGVAGHVIVRRRARKLGVSTARLNIGPVTGKRVIAGAQPPKYPRHTLPDGRRKMGRSPLWPVST